MLVGDEAPKILREWRTKEGEWIPYERLDEDHLKNIAQGLFIKRHPFGWSGVELLTIKQMIKKEIYRRMILRVIQDNQLDGERALLLTSDLPFLRKLFAKGVDKNDVP
jgi:hypothetical protein